MLLEIEKHNDDYQKNREAYAERPIFDAIFWTGPLPALPPTTIGAQGIEEHGKASAHKSPHSPVSAAARTTTSE